METISIWVSISNQVHQSPGGGHPSVSEESRHFVSESLGGGHPQESSRPETYFFLAAILSILILSCLTTLLSVLVFLLYLQQTPN